MVESITGKKLNKGEWAEFYVMLKLLGEGKLYTADKLLRKNYKSYLEKLSPLYKQDDNAELISVEKLHEAYEAIKEFTAMFDSDSIDGIIEMLRKYKIPEAEAEKFNKIAACADSADWGGLEEALQ